MRRLMLTIVASAAALVLAPASAIARHHHSRHHSRAHHARIRHERFGDLNAPTTTTPAPTTPGTPPADAVGTVGAFTNGVLTINLNGGSTVSGAVTGDTEIECESSMSQSMQSDDGGGDSGGGGDNQGGSGDENNGQDNDQDDQAENNQACTAANLTPGAFVRGAELGISSAGAVWEKVDLIP